MKSPLLLLLVFMLVLLFDTTTSQQRRSSGEDDNSRNFPKDDFSKFFRDVRKALGLDSRSLERWNRYLTKIVYEGQVYTWRQFEKDWVKLKEKPSFSNVIGFIRKVWWPAIVHGCSKIVNFFVQIQKFLLDFLEKKCDKHIGRKNQFHPWNILKTQDATNISFLVFVYMMALSFVLIKLVTVWNFTVYLSTTFLLYYIGGPKLLFKCLLTVTALAWFLLDIVLRHPLQTALLIVVMYVCGIAKHFITTSSRRAARPRAPPVDTSDTNGHPHSQQQQQQQQQQQHQRRRSSARDTVPPPEAPPADAPGRDEFNSLTKRIEGMEQRTNLLYSKLDKLAQTIERVVPDDDDE
jgi:hypothetical protein